MTIVPNSFQTPNVFIDQAMLYLTNSELRVLLFATRHIMGWQDKIKKRQGAISLTMFENGFTTTDGKRYQGCGIGKHAIITALDSLVKFGFLTREGLPTEDGQVWELHENVDWKALIARTDATEDNRRQQTKKARQKMQAKRGGSVVEQTPAGGVSDNTMQGVVGQTSTGVVEHTESKPYSKPYSKPLSAGVSLRYPKHFKDWTVAHIKQYAIQAPAHLHDLINAWGDAEIYKSIVEMPRASALQYIETFEDLERVGCEPADYYDLAEFTRGSLQWKQTINPLDMAMSHANWRRTRLAIPIKSESKPLDLSEWTDANVWGGGDYD